MRQGKRLVVVGNGPSLKAFDLRDLKGVAALGMNAAYRHWDRIGWYPTIYSCLDDQVILSHQDAIFELVRAVRCQSFFLHQNILEKYPELSTANSVYILSSFRGSDLHESIRRRYNLPYFRSRFFQTRYPAKLTTGSYALRFGAFLRYTDMLLLGIDCRYQEVIPEAEPVGDTKLKIARTPARNANYFFDDYQQAGDVYNTPNPAAHQGNLHLQSFEAIAKDFAERRASVRIRLGTKNSELHAQGVFPFVEPALFLDNGVRGTIDRFGWTVRSRLRRLMRFWR